MPTTPLLDQGSSVFCLHGGRAQPTSVSQRLRLGAHPAILLAPPWIVSGCSLLGTPQSPCLTAAFLTGSARVLASGTPLVLASAQSLCTPSGSPLSIRSTQTRVTTV
ncbi:MAG: hypothetical protein NVSMB3_09110 [Acidobacteriaceae bacterium]